MTSRNSAYDYDVAILGAGSAGYAAARTAVKHGLATAVVDGAEALGGLCILRGCMPSKALLQAAEVRHLARKGPVWGLEPSSIGFNFQRVMARKDTVIADFAADRRKQLSNGRFDLIRESGRFKAPHTLELGSGRQLTAAHFVIATGSKVSPAPLADLTEVGYLTSDDVLTRQTPPRSLIVLGGGPVALEFAQFFSRFDTTVTVIQRSPHVLKEFDDDDREAIETALTQDNIALHTGTKLLAAKTDGSQKVIEFEKQGRRFECRAEEILFGLGRIPNTEHLGLDKAGVETEQSQIITLPTQQTTAPHIYAAGDCSGPFEIVHLAVEQGETAAHNIANPGHPRRMDYRLLIKVVFTDPQVAAVGLSEREARAGGIAYRSASYPFNDHGKSIIMDAMYGHVKLLAEPTSGEILGGSCVGPAGGELIHEVVAAMHKRMTVHELAAMPHYHPTLAEIWTYPAEELAEAILVR